MYPGITRIIFFIIMAGMAGDCHEATKQQEKKTVTADSTVTFLQEEKERLNSLSKEPGYAALQTIDADSLFSYLSGYYPGLNQFPSIFLDPKKKTLTVTFVSFRQTYPVHELDKALQSYMTILVNKGYEMEGKIKDNNQYVWINGKKMVYADLADLLPDTKEARAHFTEAQYDFIYNKLDGWLGFSFLSGLGDTGRDYPLMVGLGYQESARIRVLAKGLAKEFRFTEVDSAFQVYRRYIKDLMEQ